MVALQTELGRGERYFLPDAARSRLDRERRSAAAGFVVSPRTRIDGRCLAGNCNHLLRPRRARVARCDAEAPRGSALRTSALRSARRSVYREGAIPGCGACVRSLREAPTG